MSLLVLLCEQSLASWSVFVDSETTSDDVNRLSSGITYIQKNSSLAWPYDVDLKEGEQNFGVSLLQHRVTFLNQELKGKIAELNYGLRLFNNLHLTASAGVHKLEALNQNIPNFDKSKFRPLLVLDFKPTDFLFTSISYKKDFEYQSLTLNLTSQEIIEVDTTSLILQYFTNKSRIPIRTSHRQFSDGNQRFDADIEAKVPLEQDQNWIWLGAGINYVSTLKSAAYWSPSQFHSLGPRLEFNITVLQPNLHFFGEINYNYIKEDIHHNQGYSLRIGLDKGHRNSTLYKISGFIIDSTELGQGWKTQGISAEINF